MALSFKRFYRIGPGLLLEKIDIFYLNGISIYFKPAVVAERSKALSQIQVERMP